MNPPSLRNQEPRQASILSADGPSARTASYDGWPSASAFVLAAPLGLGLILLTLLLHRSEVNRVVFGRWSYLFAGLLVVTAVLFFWSILQSLRRVSDPHRLDRFTRWSHGSTGIAVLVLGLAKLSNVLDRGSAAIPISDLHFFGSVEPRAATLEWLSILLFFLGAVAWSLKTCRRQLVRRSVPVISVFAVCLLAEGIARILVLTDPQPRGWGTFAARAWEKNNVQLNKLGFRDREHPALPAAPTQRLLVVGDSFAYGWGVPANARFGERAANLLTSRTAHNWQPLHASHPGTDTIDHIDYLNTMLAYSPDVVALAYVFNDIEYLTEANVPLHASSWITRLFVGNSFLLQELFLRVRLMNYSYLQPDDSAFGNMRLNPYSDSQLLARHITDLHSFVQIGSRRSRKILVVPFDLEFLRGPLFMDRYNNFLAQAKDAGIPVWDTRAVFRSHCYQDLILNRFDHHPNARAHALMGSALADHLDRELANSQ